VRDSDNTNISFSASKSSAIYKDNGHVIPKSMTVIYLICYKVIGTYIGGGYGGGVIDGTLLKPTTTTTSRSYTTNTTTPIYSVANDCLLYVVINSGIDSNYPGIEVLVNNSPCGVFDLYNDAGMGLSIPVKKGSVISIRTTTRPYTGTFTLYEYKLNSLAPQIAMPDYSATPTTVTDGWTAPENGWLITKGETPQGTQFGYATVKIGTVEVWSAGWTGAYGYTTRDVQATIVPISKGQIVTINTSYIIVYCNFYPCKSVPQPDCASYVIETGKFSSVDGTKHTTASENDSWYRLYSDGWCE